jgi:sulfonate transport system ATP-binding protein
MRPRPGRLFEQAEISLARPRDRNSELFETTKRRILTALDRSLDQAAPDPTAAAETGDALWW